MFNKILLDIRLNHLPSELIYRIYLYVNPMTTIHSVIINTKFNKLLLDDKNLSKQYQVIKFIEQNIDKVEWSLLSKNNIFSEDFYLFHPDKIDWCWLSYNENLSNEFCQKYIEKLKFNYLCSHRTKEFIMRNVTHNNKIIGWVDICYNNKIDEQFYIDNLIKSFGFLCVKTITLAKIFLRSILIMLIGWIYAEIGILVKIFSLNT